jgi:hypothetical protein
MLEPITTTLVTIAATLSIIADAIASISASLATILAASLAGILSIAGACSAIASVLPPAKEPGTYKLFHSFVNKVAFNIGHAANRVNHIEEEK